MGVNVKFPTRYRVKKRSGFIRTLEKALCVIMV